MLDFSESIKEYAPLSKEDAFKFIYENEALRECIRHNRMIFVDGYFVIADLKYFLNSCYNHIYAYLENIFARNIIHTLDSLESLL